MPSAENLLTSSYSMSLMRQNKLLNAVLMLYTINFLKDFLLNVSFNGIFINLHLAQANLNKIGIRGKNVKLIYE